MLISYSHWIAILTRLAVLAKPMPEPKFDLIGSIKIKGDLEAGSREITQMFKKAIKKSAKAL